MSTFRIKPLAAGALLAVAAAAAQAQPPGPPQPQAPSAALPAPAPSLAPPAPRPEAGPERRPPVDRAPEQTIRGTVHGYLLTPAGDVNGLLLEDGTQVDVPPHLSARLSAAVHVRDQVEVIGVRAPGSPLVRATEVRGPSPSSVVRVDGPPAPMPPVRAAAAAPLAPMTASGRIVALLYSPRGEVGGVLTQDGTQVRFPPQADPGHALAVGKSVYARGFGTQGPQGRALEATAVGSSAGDAQAVFAPPAPRPGEPPAPDAPRPGAGPQAPAAAGPAAER